MTPPLAIPVNAQLTGADPAGLAAFARAAEAAGFGRLWAPELHRSSTIPLAVAAAATDRIGIATGIALAFTRSPMVLALEALDLDELSGGRMTIGLGAGVRRLNADWHAAPYDPPLRRMRETVAAVRELTAALAGGRDARAEGGLVGVDVRGLRRPHVAPRAAIPVWLAAVLPGMTRLTGASRTASSTIRSRAPSGCATACCRVARRGRARRPAGARGRGRAHLRRRRRRPRRRPAGGGRHRRLLRDGPHLRRDVLRARLRPAPARDPHGVRRRRRRADDRRRRPRHDRGLRGRGDPRRRGRPGAGPRGPRDRLWATPPHHLQDDGDVRRWQAGILEAFGAR